MKCSHRKKLKQFVPCVGCEIDFLVMENDKLRKQLDFSRAMYAQLLINSMKEIKRIEALKSPHDGKE